MPDDRETSEDFFAMDATFIGEMIKLTVGGEHDGGFQAYGHGEEVLQEDETILGQHYGFSSNPPEGTELILQPLESGADASLAEIPGTRPTLASGESKQWAGEGQYVHMKSTGQVDIKAKIGQAIVTLSRTLLGSAAAAEALVKGTTFLSAMTAWFTGLNVFFTAWNTELETLKNAATHAEVATYATNVQTALGALQTALTAVQATLAVWLSIKHALDV